MPVRATDIENLCVTLGRLPGARWRRHLVEVRAHPRLAVVVCKGAGTRVESWKVFGTAADRIISGPMLCDRRSDEHTPHDEAANYWP